MSHYIKKAINSYQELAFYIGKTRLCPITQRANPKNQLVSEFAKNGQMHWRTIKNIQDSELHPEFGESFLINCFRDKLGHLLLLNKNIPNAMALVYDKKSELIIDEISKELS
tara:strand:- start:489 stop:824 length:336 start_codon:yes stop_codon:yes gene_type:complete